MQGTAESRNRKKIARRIVVLPDIHAPLHDVPACNVAFRAIEMVKPDEVILLGDIGEWDSVSHWQWRKKKRPPLDYQLPAVDIEIAEVNAFLDLLDKSLHKAKVKRRTVITGNHDAWLDNFVEENKSLGRLGYRFHDACRLRERGYSVIPFGDIYKVGHIRFYHGHHFGGIHHARNHLLRLGCNIIYGHWHDIQEASVTHVEGARAAWCIGCLKDMRHEANLWLGRRAHNWAHAIAIVDVQENGMFTVNTIRIINGVASVWGKIIDCGLRPKSQSKPHRKTGQVSNVLK